jgi:methionyl aminopeptidase
MIIRKSAQEIDGMARAGQLVAGTIAVMGEHIQPGITTGDLDRIAEEFIRDHGAVPTSKGYRGFPAATCISPNAMVVHGIPGEHRVEEGDLISVDVGITLDGLVADSAYTYAVGEVDDESARLLEVGKQALDAGIARARAGNRVGDISHAIQEVVEGAGFAVVRSLVGHGVGRSYHEEPQIPNFGEPGRGPLLQTGMTLAIEPMITAGGPDVYLHDDEWSISTTDGSMAAHFEHTVAVQDGAARILTRAKTPAKAGLLPYSARGGPSRRVFVRKEERRIGE